MINIQDIIPFMCDGFVFMERDGTWEYNQTEPKIITNRVRNYKCWDRGFSLDEFFDIAPADDWTKSLIKVGGK
jgi:hypothetical protein